MPSIDRLILAGGPGERRIALMRGDQVTGFVVDRFAPAEGDLVLGRVLLRPSGLTAAFIEIGDDQPGFLSRPGAVGVGDAVLVQITAAARRDKGATLTARPALAGRFLVYEPFRPGIALSRGLAGDAAVEALAATLSLAADEGVLLRSRAGAADAAQLACELSDLRQIWRAARTSPAAPPARLWAPGALARILLQEDAVAAVEVDDPALLPEARRLFAAARLDPGIWRHSGAADALDSALAREVPLPGGGRLLIDETAGATVIDIDGGGLPAAAANRAALTEIARQLPLREVAGHVLIDLIPLGDKAAATALVEEFRLMLGDDRAQIVGLTRLGLLELTRARRRPSLAELFLRPSQAERSAASLALEALQAVLAEQTARPALIPLLLAAPAIIRYLDSRPELLAETAQRLGRPLSLQARPEIATFEVSDAR